MNNVKMCGKVAGWAAWLTFVMLNLEPIQASAMEESFPVLQIGTHSYTNVTVTTKAKDYIFLLHSTGMLNVKVSDLEPELREKLGYVVAKPKVQNTPGAVAKAALAKVETPAVKSVETKAQALLDQHQEDIARLKEAATPKALAIAGGVAFLVYLFFCYCCNLICTKAGREPSAVVWLPLFQVIPLLRAARMSGWWFFVWLVPVLNLVPYVIWSFKIVSVRKLNFLISVLLLLGATAPFAFLILAFAEAAPKKEDRRVEIMTLEAA